MSTPVAGVPIFVLSVTRDLADELGGEVAERLVSAGHVLAGRDLTLPDVDGADRALARRLADPRVRAVLVCGGADLWAGDAGSRAVAARVTRPLPGLAELYRGLAFPSRGAAVLLDAVCGGLTDSGKAVFALPADLDAALLLLDQLVLPNLVALLDRAGGAAAAPALPAPTANAARPEPARASPPVPAPVEPEEVPVSDRVSVVPIVHARPEETKEALASGWEAGMRALGGELQKRWPTLPEALDRMAAAREVLESAPQVAEIVLKDGTRYGAFAWPDFNRTQAKVLLVREAEPFPEILALHRQPRLCGTCVDGGTALPSSDLLPGPVCERLVGAPPPADGELFAIENDAVYLLRDRKVWRWDGRRESDQGTPAQCIASLLLRWSQK